MSQAEETLWSQYEDLGLIGMGAFSKVRKARHRLTGVVVAIKALEKQRRIYAVVLEVEVMKMLDHPNTPSLFQIVDTKDTIYLVMELCHRDLMEHIYWNGCLQEDEARQIFKQILDAISYCHSHGIVHQDIKPDNIMVDDRGKVTVIDFGLATRFLPGQMLTRYCGAYKYMPPEAILRQSYDGPKKDMWSLGVLLFFMVTRTMPFNAKTLTELKEEIVKGDYQFPQALSEELKDLIRLLLTVDPERRPTTAEVINHPWLEQGQGGSDSRPPLPRQPDTNIISAMEFMRFDADDIVEALRERRYDRTMATYLLLKYQARCRVGDQAEDKPVCPGTTPFPTPTDRAAFPVAPKMRHPAPVFRTLSSGLAAQEQPDDGPQAEPKEIRTASLPNLHISWPKKKPSAKQSPPCPHPADISDRATEPSNRGLRGRLKALRSRIQGCLRRLFHRRHLHLFRKRVSPQQAADIQEDDEAPVSQEDTSMCIPCVCGRRGKVRPS
uniref:sperm motility kinase 2B-like n=1 Tax=Jaculus jaculus TaxID=51337 RepID=UPI001E1B4931|nr:sperm motility kinase 2B-like [Jaculus jaculus]